MVNCPIVRPSTMLGGCFPRDGPGFRNCPSVSSRVRLSVSEGGERTLLAVARSPWTFALRYRPRVFSTRCFYSSGPYTSSRPRVECRGLFDSCNGAQQRRDDSSLLWEQIRMLFTSCHLCRLLVGLTGGGLRAQMRLYPRVGVFANWRPRPPLLLLPLLLVLFLLLFAKEPACSMVAWRREI